MKRFLKAKSECEKKNWKGESQKQKFYLYHFFNHFFPPFPNRIEWTTQIFHFESYEIFGKKWKWKVLSEKRKHFWKWKAKSKSRKNYWKAESQKQNLQFWKLQAKSKSGSFMILLSNSACYTMDTLQQCKGCIRRGEGWRAQRIQIS